MKTNKKLMLYILEKIIELSLVKDSYDKKRIEEKAFFLLKAKNEIEKEEIRYLIIPKIKLKICNKKIVKIKKMEKNAFNYFHKFLIGLLKRNKLKSASGSNDFYLVKEILFEETTNSDGIKKLEKIPY